MELRLLEHTYGSVLIFFLVYQSRAALNGLQGPNRFKSLEPPQVVTLQLNCNAQTSIKVHLHLLALNTQWAINHMWLNWVQAWTSNQQSQKLEITESLDIMTEIAGICDSIMTKTHKRQKAWEIEGVSCLMMRNGCRSGSSIYGISINRLETRNTECQTQTFVSVSYHFIIKNGCCSSCMGGASSY